MFQPEFLGRPRLCRPLLMFVAGCVVMWAQMAAAQSIVAHRGASREAPENTLAAFELAWERGADAIEGDFRLSADGQIVCIHDGDTQRVAKRKLIVADSSYEQLRSLDVGSWKDSRWVGQRIPTLKQVLQTVPAGKRVLIEIKCGPEIVPALKQVLNAGWSEIEMVIISFEQDVVAACKQQLPEIDAYWLTSFDKHPKTGVWEPSIETILSVLKATQADGVDCRAEPKACTPELIARIREQGLEWHCWTINDPDLALTFHRLGVDSITTDRPKFLRRHLPSRKLKKHLQLHLGFEGRIMDRAEQQRPVHLHGAPATDVRYVPGVFGQALQLDGKHYVAVDYRLPETGALCLWYLAHEWYNYQTIFDQSLDANAWEMWIDSQSRLKFRLSSKQKHPLQHNLHPIGDRRSWQHLAVTWSRDAQEQADVRLFVNGTLREAVVIPASQWPTIGTQFFLGGGNSGNTRGRGIIDEVYVFDCRIRQGDIYRLMRLGAQGLLD